LAQGWQEYEQQRISRWLGDSQLALAAAACRSYLHAAGASWAQVRAHSKRAAQGPEAQQPAAQCIM
jgi:hypothetical protein